MEDNRIQRSRKMSERRGGGDSGEGRKVSRRDELR